MSCVKCSMAANWREEVSGISPMGFSCWPSSNFGATGASHFPSMPSPRCISSVPRSLHGAFGYERGSLTCLSWSPGGAYRACNLTCAMTRLLILTPSQNTKDKFPNNPPGQDPKLSPGVPQHLASGKRLNRHSLLAVGS